MSTLKEAARDVTKGVEQGASQGLRARLRENLRMLGKLTVVASVMFAFGWALIPLYRTICEITGINNLTQVDRDAQDFARNTQVDQTRKVSVEFDANSRGPWQFKPETTALEVHPGELVTVIYRVTNNLSETVAGQAIPSYAPQQSAAYFRKVECFCFRQQTLAPHESREFPVVFVVDPKLPADVQTITLSYTLFKVEGVSAVGGPPETAPAPARAAGA